MCDVVSAVVSGVSLLANAAGTGVKLAGASAEADARAQIAAQNQGIANSAAVNAELRGAAEAGSYQMKLGQFIGKQRAAMGAAGADVSTGTPLATQESTRAVGQMDVDRIRANAALEAWGLRSQAANIGLQAQLDEKRSGYELAGGFLSGLGGLADSASKSPLMKRIYDGPKITS